MSSADSAEVLSALLDFGLVGSVGGSPPEHPLALTALIEFLPGLHDTARACRFVDTLVGAASNSEAAAVRLSRGGLLRGALEWALCGGVEPALRLALMRLIRELARGWIGVEEMRMMIDAVLRPQRSTEADVEAGVEADVDVEAEAEAEAGTEREAEAGTEREAETQLHFDRIWIREMLEISSGQASHSGASHPTLPYAILSPSSRIRLRLEGRSWPPAAAYTVGSWVRCPSQGGVVGGGGRLVGGLFGRRRRSRRRRRRSVSHSASLAHAL